MNMLFLRPIYVVLASNSALFCIKNSPRILSGISGLPNNRQNRMLDVENSEFLLFSSQPLHALQ